MLCGRADPEALAKRAPTMERFDAPAVSLGECEIAQILYEIEGDVAEAILPPGLHPTLPGVVSWLVWAGDATPWGRVRMVQTRLECRSGNRPRAMLLGGVCDNAAARDALTRDFGYRLRAGEIEYRRGYDGADLRVRCDGREVLSLELRDPVLLPAEVVQFVSAMHPAHTPKGFRLVQVDADHHVTRSERVTPRLRAFDAGAWGDARVEPRYAVAGAVCRGEIAIAALRFVCKAGEMAFGGTEAVARVEPGLTPSSSP